MLDPDSFVVRCAEVAEERLKNRNPKRKCRWRGPAFTVRELLRLSDDRVRGRYECYLRRGESGKEREIARPIDGVKFLSQELAKEIWEPFGADLENCVQAYVSGRCHLSNAAAHLWSREILEIDLRRAFPTITRQMAGTALRKYMPNQEAFFVAGIACHKDRLTQGNPLSPLIFLIVTLKLTQRLAALARIYGLNLTIYADNITLSGRHLPSGLERKVCEIIESEGFEPHNPGDKHRRMGKTYNEDKIVTGILITRSGLALPKKKRRRTEALISQALSPALLDDTAPGTERDRLRDQVTGSLIYSASIDPSIKQKLCKLLAHKELRRQLRTNLTACRARQIFRILRKDTMLWERYLTEGTGA